MAMDRAIQDYQVQGNATNCEVDNVINFCLIFTKGRIKARYELSSLGTLTMPSSNTV